MTTTLTRPEPALDITEQYDRETGNLTFRTQSQQPYAPSRFAADDGALSSPTVTLLFEALAKAQGEIEHALKDTEGQTGNQLYNYATLGNVYDASRKHLRDNGLAVTHRQRTIDGGVEVEAVLTHSSGEWISGGALFMPCELTAKAIGSALTYARRYTYSAIVGVAAEDDDGTNADESTPAAGKKKRQPAKKSSKFEPLTEWRWGKEKGTPLQLVTDRSLEWLVGQEKYGNPDDRARAAAEIERRKSERVPGGELDIAQDAGEQPQEAPLSDVTRGTLIELLISTGLAPDEEACNALIDEKGDGTEGWGTRQITLLRQRTDAPEAGDE